MKTRVAVVLLLLLVIISLGAWVAWKRTQYPEALLADGTRVQFLGYTHRESHSNFVGSPLKERIRSKLPPKLKPILGSSFLRAKSAALPEHPVAWLLVTRPTGAPAAARNPFSGASGRIDVVDSHGCVFAAKDWHYSGGATDGQQWLIFRPMPVFPRREPEITLRFVDQAGSVSAMSIPNPEYRKYPEWRPERIVQRTNGFTAEFFGWRSARSPEISVRHGNNAPTEAWPRNLRLADATGNSNASSLCRMESALRIQDEIIVRPLKPGDMLQMRSLHLPQPNEVQLKQQKLRAGTNEIVFIAITGKGRYSVSCDGFTNEGTTVHPLLFLQFPIQTRPHDFVVWVNNRRASVTRSGVTSAGRPVYAYLLDVPTAVVNVEVGLEPCIQIDLLVPALPAGRPL